RVGAVLAGHARERGGEMRARCPDADHDRHAAGDVLDDRLNDAAPLLIGQAVRLAGDTEDGDAADRGGEHAVHEVREAARVELAAVGERRREDVEDARPADQGRTSTQPPRAAASRVASRTAARGGWVEVLP